MSGTSPTVREKVERGPMYDMAIIRHGLSPSYRDYDIIVYAKLFDDISHLYVSEVPQESEFKNRWTWFRYRFSHCVLAETTTVMTPEIWQESWSDLLLDYDAWKASDTPAAYVWGVNHLVVEPGPRYVADSAEAREWSEKLQHPMHEVVIETNVQTLRLIFHDLTIARIPPEQDFPEDDGPPPPPSPPRFGEWAARVRAAGH